MSKWKNKSQREDEIACVCVDDIHVPEKTWSNVMRDVGQIEQMRANFECGGRTMRVVLRPRFGGGFNIEDGRHRVIAAKLAGVSHIEAVIVGS